MMKKLLILMGVGEAATGIALLVVPQLVVRLLLGAELTGAGLLVAGVTGIALLALGVACWLARNDAQSCAAKGLVGAMVAYNLGAVIIFGAAGVRLQPVGVALWPAVVLHAGMTVWCIVCLTERKGGVS